MAIAADQWVVQQQVMQLCSGCCLYELRNAQFCLQPGPEPSRIERYIFILLIKVIPFTVQRDFDSDRARITRGFATPRDKQSITLRDPTRLTKQGT